MPVYLDVLVVLNFLVDLLLLMGANRLAGHPVNLPRSAVAAGVGGVYAGVCMFPLTAFLAGSLWRLAILLLMAGIAFGFHRYSLRRAVLFVLLSMALGGVAVGMKSRGAVTLLLCAAAVCALCIFGFRGRAGQQFLPVQIEKCCFTALVDTGNSLTDPLTGQPVLVVSSRVGQTLLSIPAAELAEPLVLMGKIPGVRLLPYQAVGLKDGVLPAKRFPDVRIGTHRGSGLVAFAPNELGNGYDALTGGIL